MCDYSFGFPRFQQLKDSYSEETKMSSVEEVSLVIKEMTPAPDLLPIISVIREVQNPKMIVGIRLSNKI
jgi:hypothetical protein